jgi:PAS domain S-box-containing protein
MEQKELLDLREAVSRLQEENRALRSALETTDCGSVLLRQGEEFSRLLSISKLIVAELDLAEVFNQVANNAREIVNAEMVLLPMLNESRDQYTYVAASGAEADVVRGTTLSANVGMCGWVLKHQRSLLFGETSTHWMDEMTTWEEGQQSAVLVPLLGRKGIIGGLSAIGKQGGGCFTQHDLDLLTMFANQVSVAIENASLFQQHEMFVQGLQAVTECFLSFGPDSLANIGAITMTAGRILQATCALYNRKEGELMVILAGWQTPPDMPLSREGKGCPCFDMIGQGRNEPVIMRNLQKTQYAESDPNISKYGYQMYVGYPVMLAGQAVASLCTVFQADAVISSYQLSLLHVLSKAASVEEERMRAETALRVSETRFRSITENASVGILAADVATHHFRYANPVICRMLGYSRSELLDLDIQSIHPASELTRVEASFSGGQGIQTSCRRSDGSLFPVDIKTVRMELDGIPCLVGFYTDTTERHLLDEERLKTQKLEAIGTLAGGIAHDFNNLLQSIFGYISMAKLTHDQKEQSLSMLDQAEEALVLSVNLSKQLLTFSKGGNPLKKIISLRPVIENSTRFALSGSRVESRITLEEGLWAVEADEGQISQVIQNIVLNAAQAMPEGGTVVIAGRNVTVADKDWPLLPDGNYVEISVQDTGVGIPEQQLQQIFDPYYTTKEKGSGLGLATSYSIVSNHGGVINVTSEPGKGSTFFIFLPAADKVAKEKKETPVLSSVIRTGKILVMDDEELVLNLAGLQIKTLGYEVDLAKNGEAALEKYQAAMDSGKPFDIVILDLTIRGGMSGMETLKRLHSIHPGVKAIVSSGYSDDDVLANYEQYGFKARLTKPYRREALRDTLNTLLSA